MDYQTPLRIVNIAKDLLLTVPDNDQLINWTLTRDDVADTSGILVHLGYKAMAAFLLHTKSLYPDADSEVLSEIKHLKILKDWMYNKQLFVVDGDFFDTLIDTEEITLTKEIFDYLPFKTFYVDLSQSKTAKSDLDCNGMFVNIHKEDIRNCEPDSRPYEVYLEYREKLKISQNVNDLWIVHCIRENDTTEYHDIFAFPDDDVTISSSVFNKAKKVLKYEYDDNKNPTAKKVNESRLNEQTYYRFVCQFLLYLASYKPDISENTDTKRVYRKPNPAFPPKNKFSEIKAYDTGVKIGTAVREWRKKKGNNVSYSSTPTGRKNRPHSVRGHWRKQWYGPRGKQEQRLIWIHEFYTGVKEESSVIVHKTE